MSYRYEDQRPKLLSPENIVVALRIRDTFLNAMIDTEAARAGRILHYANEFDDSWMMMAVLDFMVEMGDVRYVEGTTGRAWQDQIVELCK